MEMYDKWLCHVRKTIGSEDTLRYVDEPTLRDCVLSFCGDETLDHSIKSVKLLSALLLKYPHSSYEEIPSENLSSILKQAMIEWDDHVGRSLNGDPNDFYNGIAPLSEMKKLIRSFICFSNLSRLQGAVVSEILADRYSYIEKPLFKNIRDRLDKIMDVQFDSGMCNNFLKELKENGLDIKNMKHEDVSHILSFYLLENGKHVSKLKLQYITTLLCNCDDKPSLVSPFRTSTMWEQSSNTICVAVEFSYCDPPMWLSDGTLHSNLASFLSDYCVDPFSITLSEIDVGELKIFTTMSHKILFINSWSENDGSRQATIAIWIPFLNAQLSINMLDS